MSDDLLIDDVQPPPTARQYSNIDDMHQVLVGLHAWAVQHMRLFSELIPEDAAATQLRSIPTKAFLHNQSLFILNSQLSSTRRIREWYDYLVRENENNWTIQKVLRERLQLLQVAISFINQLGETLEQRELREEQARGGIAIVMAPGMIVPDAGARQHGHGNIPPPPSFGQTS